MQKMFKEKYKQNLGSTTEAVVRVGRGERAGGDHGKVQDGGWGVGVSLLTSCFRKMEYGIKNKIVFFGFWQELCLK